ncbi:MAG: AIR carboxylase family protein, partial [Lacticaseibacillus paracasei]|nr:AIR carboxylase family protein [Lacticaseibacillus paracasei]
MTCYSQNILKKAGNEMQKVAVVMGSTSDWPTMQQVTAQLTS